MEKQNNYQEVSPITQLAAWTNDYTANRNIPVEFPGELLSLTTADITPESCYHRRNLRNLPCFTIDSDDTNDMDDAVCLLKTESGYNLSVHIADVASYVTPGSELECCALQRGTSIYLPHTTIPMLPPVLSDNLCSLNPHLDRKAISILIDMDKDCNVLDYRLTKSTICSRVKGVYSEVDSILDGCRNKKLTEKYSGLIEMLYDMRCVADKLREDRERNGANISLNIATKFVVKNQRIERIISEKGASHQIIEEFMVLANRLVAEYLRANRLPSILRTQKEVKKKASYLALKECGHAELALDRYAHFTSPIRRLADLKVHQVLTAHLYGIETEAIWTTFTRDLVESAKIATRCENRWEDLERDCNRKCATLFLTPKQNNEFCAEVVGFNYRNRAILMISKYRIQIIGHAGMRAALGQKVAVKLAVDIDNTSVEVISCQRILHPVA